MVSDGFSGMGCYGMLWRLERQIGREWEKVEDEPAKGMRILMVNTLPKTPRRKVFVCRRGMSSVV